MLENPAPAAQPDSTTIVKRYPPPNQRQAFFSFTFAYWYLLHEPKMRHKVMLFQ